MSDSTFLLKHKDITVLKFIFDEKYQIKTLVNVYNAKHTPVGILNNYTLSATDGLQYWWSHRTIPASRNNLENKLELLDIKNTSELLHKSFGLSLTDHYWIMPESTELKWHDINYYENDFSDNIGKLLFDNINQLPDNFNYNSPDNSSDGNLQKKWAIDESGVRVLIKGGDVFSPQEAFNEVIASKVFELLNIPHANYKLLENKEKKVFYSVTPNFTSENIEFINANHIMASFPPAKQNINKYEYFISCCEESGIKRELFEKDLVSMFFVDYILGNKDRHYRNFGFLRDSETLEWKGLAPVFDTGNSLFEGLADIDLHDNYFTDSINIEAKPFASNQQEQLNLIPFKKYCSDLRLDKLEGIYSFVDNLLEKNYRMSSDRKQMVNRLLRERIEYAKRLLLPMN